MKKESIFEKRYTHYKELGLEMGWHLSYWEQFDCIEISRMENVRCAFHGYIGSVKPIFNSQKDIKAKCYEFNGKQYSVLIDAIKDVEEFSKTLEYPAYTYQVSNNAFYRIQERVDWYMTEVLKFSRYKDQFELNPTVLRFHRPDMYGVSHYRLNIHFDTKLDCNTEDCCKGAICYYINEFRFVEKKFNDMEEFKKSVNGFVEPFLLIDNSLNLSVMQNIQDKERDYNTEDVSIGDVFNPKRHSCLTETKKALEMALERINKQLEAKEGN